MSVLWDIVVAVGHAIEQVVKAVAVGVGDEFARFAGDVGIKKNRHVAGVPIMRVVWRRLKVPHQLPGVRIERDDRARPEVVAFAAAAGSVAVRS